MNILTCLLHVIVFSVGACCSVCDSCVCVCVCVLKSAQILVHVCDSMGRRRIPDLISKKGAGDHAAEPQDSPPRKKANTVARSDLCTEKPLPSSSSFAEEPVCEPYEPHDKCVSEYHKFVWDMWLRNEASAKFVQTLADKSQKAGAQGVEDIARVGNCGQAPNNSSRDLKRQAIKKRKLSPPYYADIPCWNDDLERCENVSIPFFIPYEMMYVLIKSGALSLLTLCNVMVGSAFASIKDEICKRLTVDPTKHVVIGLHTDGVPMQKSGATIEVQSFNFPNMPHCERLLWSVLAKKWFCKCGCSGRHTLDKIWELLVWQSEQMLMGFFAKCRHDN